MRKYLLLLLTICIASTSFSQDFSNKGKEFWLAYSYHVGMSGGSGTPVMTLYITSDVSTTCTVDIYGVATLATVAITPGVVTPVVIPNAYFINDDGLFLNKAIHVTAAKPVVVYSFITRAQASAATLCLPTNVLGKQYYGMSFTQVSNENNSNSYITIVGVEDNTSIEIIPTVPTKGGWAAGSTNVINLNKGQVYQVLGTTTGNNGVDISGTSVRSIASGSGGCKKIAVFSGSGKLTIGCSGPPGSSDNLYQQLYPVASWGKKYVTVPSYNRINNPYRIMRSDPLANVYLNGVLIPAASFVNGYYEFMNNTPNMIESDLPISVTQYFTSQNCSGNGSPYDPDMIELNPVEQNINKVTLISSPLTAGGTQQHNIHVIMKNTGATTTAFSSFTFDGNPVPAANWTVHPADPNYSYLYLSNVTQTRHILASDSGFNAVAYGYANAETYGYSAGTNVKDLYQQVRVQTQYGIEETPSVCTGSPFKFKISLPYLVDSLFWDLSQLPTAPPSVLMNYSHPPVPADADSVTVVNGKNIYWYSLPAYYTFNVIGSFPVNIKAYTANSDGCGNVQDIPFDLDISDPPVADFGWLSNGCVNQAVQFQDITESVRPLYHWWWDFGDPASGAANNTSGLQNPTHMFSAPGTYTVRFSNITTPGCLSDTISKQITVTNIPVADFTFSSPLCEGRTVTITDASSASLPGVLAKWYWDLGDGNPPITALNNNAQTVTYPAWGPRTVTLKVETNSGCQSLVTTRNITINAVPVPQFTHLQACLPYETIKFTNTSTVADGTAMTYAWNFGDPGSGALNTSTVTSPQHLYSAVGPFNVQLTATNTGGCANSTTVSISDIYPQAHGSFTVTAPENCFNTPTVFTSTSTGSGATITNWYWDFGDGSGISTTQNPSHTYATAGTKTIKHWIKTVNGCMSDTATQTVIINPLPTTDFNFTVPTCETRVISFNDLSVANAGNIVSWAWDFNDPASGANNTSALQNPTHEFAGTGTYNVKLTVTTDKGCISTLFTKPVPVNARPQAGYIVPEVCLNDTYAQFTDTSHVAAGTISNWAWNFGDANANAGNPNTSTLQNPPHSYTATGSYNVQLIVTSNQGCKDTISHTLYVNGSFPVSNFTVAAGALCANDSVRITNTATVFPGTITKIEIFWDDVNQPGIIETDDNPVPGRVYSHLYPNFQNPLTKTFNIRFRAYSGGVCSNDKVQTITVNAAPKVQFNAVPNTCLNVVPFQITQANEVGGVPGTFVYSGPGVSSSGMFDPLSVGPGLYTLHYKFTSSFGCADSATQQIRVLEPPVAKFGYGAPACETQSLVFSDTSSAPVGTLTTWTWDFDDATPLVVNNSPADFTHTFAAAGIYHVKLFVTTSDGCNSSVKTRDVEIKPMPRPGFRFADTSCLPNAVITFNNTSSIPDGTENQFTYLWNFGDPGSGLSNTATSLNPSHQYIAQGPYNVTLQVTSGANCVHDTVIVLNTIHPQPKADFDFNKPSVCIGDDVVFRDLSDGKDGPVTAWHWDFGDITTSNLQNPSHTYNNIGTYDVSFYSINSFGCNSDTVSKSYNVYPYPVVDAGPDKFVLEGGQTTISPTVSGNDLQFLWTPNLYLNSNTIEAPTCTPLQDITYTLAVTARGGCVATDQVFVKVLPMPKIPNTFSPNNDGINDLWVIQYLDTYPFNRVQVFTRTGQLVFESRGYKTPWNGTMNGKSLPVDTYYYIIEPGSGRQPLTGYVTIVK